MLFAPYTGGYQLGPNSDKRTIGAANLLKTVGWAWVQTSRTRLIPLCLRRIVRTLIPNMSRFSKPSASLILRAKPTKADLLASTNKTVPDVISPSLILLFCGINPGLYSAYTGHHFAR